LQEGISGPAREAKGDELAEAEDAKKAPVTLPAGTLLQARA
jgi:hypothetical protein